MVLLLLLIVLKLARLRAHAGRLLLSPLRLTISHPQVLLDNLHGSLTHNFPRRNIILGRVRFLLREHRVASGPPSDRVAAVSLRFDPFTLLGFFINDIYGNLLETHHDLELDEEDWSDPLFHHIVVSAALWNRTVKAEVRPDLDQPEVVRELLVLIAGSLTPILAILTSLHHRNQQLAANLAVLIGAAECFPAISPVFVDGAYDIQYAGGAD